MEDILNRKHFTLESRKHFKAILISLVLLLSSVVMLFDIYESILQGHSMIIWLEGFSIAILSFTYLLFPRYISLQTTLYSTISVLSALIIISLSIPAAHPQSALFWLATLPIYIFFFLGSKRGIQWTVAILVALIITTLNCKYKWIPPLYSFEFMIQILIGYIAISYLLYFLENERQDYENNLLHLAKTRKILLKEVHHRTKNNMQIMIALLDTQAFKIDNKKYKHMFQSHVNRLKAMSLIHEHLYSGEDYDNVEIGTYLKEITTNLQHLTRHKIRVDIDNIVLDMKTAMNLGLIYNEAISNAIEHAYTQDDIGNIQISLKRLNGSCVLKVKDDGRGFDAHKKYQTLGLTLMEDISRTLHEQKIKIKSDHNGTQIILYCILNKEERV